MHNHGISTVLAQHPKTTFFRLFLEKSKFKSRENLARKFNNFGVNNFSSSCTWYIQIFRPMASFRELSCTSRPCLLYIVDISFRKNKEPKRDHFHFTFTFTSFTTSWKEVDSVGRLKDSKCKTSHFFAWKSF